MAWQDGFNKWIRENSKWFIWLLIGFVAVWIWGEGNVFSWNLSENWAFGALFVLGYIFHLIRKDFREMASGTVKEQEPQPPTPPTKADFTKGKPFSLDFGDGQ